MSTKKYGGIINGKYDATLAIVESEHDGEKFYFGTGIVVSEFQHWFSEQVAEANEKNEKFEGRVLVELEDGRIGRALINSIIFKGHDTGTKISFVFHGGINIKKGSHAQ